MRIRDRSSDVCSSDLTLIRIFEWYGSKGATKSVGGLMPKSGELGFNQGVKFSTKDIATGIKVIERHLQKEGWIGRKVEAGPADNQIRDVDRKSTRLNSSH